MADDNQNVDEKQRTRGKLRLIVNSALEEESVFKTIARETAAVKLADWLEQEHLRTEGRARRQSITVESFPAEDVVLLAVEMLFARGFSANFTVNNCGEGRHRGSVWITRRANFFR
ncbi:MAG: hypothetical protein P4L53_14365 [Candidatus Obscuribacterales bacterium]|nr:hypothetical protein [Candidatus Obscuribacterales bacterium]